MLRNCKEVIESVAWCMLQFLGDQVQAMAPVGPRIVGAVLVDSCCRAIWLSTLEAREFKSHALQSYRGP